MALLIMLLAVFIVPVVAEDVNVWIADLRDPNQSVRETAAEALDKLNDSREVEHLKSALNDEDEDPGQEKLKQLQTLHSRLWREVAQSCQQQDNSMRCALDCQREIKL